MTKMEMGLFTWMILFASLPTELCLTETHRGGQLITLRNFGAIPHAILMNIPTHRRTRMQTFRRTEFISWGEYLYCSLELCFIIRKWLENLPWHFGLTMDIRCSVCRLWHSWRWIAVALRTLHIWDLATLKMRLTPTDHNTLSIPFCLRPCRLHNIYSRNKKEASLQTY